MANFALELNDCGVVAVWKDAPAEPIVAESPGYALLEDHDVLTGDAARAKARVRPRFVHTRFWDALDTGALGRPFPPKLTRADLAHAHLSSFWRSLPNHAGGEAVLAIPGWYSLEQLGLILGMARASDMSITAMIDSALAAAATQTEGRALIHLDLHLHRVVAARVLRDEALVRESTLVDDTVGQIALHDALVTRVSECFVQRTRFDPLHSAETEQRMYDELPSWISALSARGNVSIRMSAPAKEHELELELRDVAQAAQPYYDAVSALAAELLPTEHSATLLVSARLGAFFGLVEQLKRDVCERIVVLPATAAAAGALAYGPRGADGAEGDGLTFLTSLSLGGPDAEPTSPLPARADVVRPTHVLHAGSAHAIEPGPFLLGVSIPDGKRGLNLTGNTAGISRYHCSIYRIDERVVVEDHSKFGSFLNGHRVADKQPLAAGDRLRLGTPGIELQLIEVKD